ncbi:Trafficking protein particle complex subunit [Citrus sinensis]|uniref:Trafficking protein particle complex subunit n=1 Tax=Citrus sinensis TaxID=2711 RepID=A0ACB8P912_CITSI|nr:Trafficking protein particle complex subunit [Citrus sinensis]
MIGVGKIKQYSNVLDKPLSKGKQEVSLSAFAFLFSELVQYNQTQVDNIAELERRLEDAGYAVGARVLELLCHRDKVADSLEKGTEHEDEYMISEKELLVNRFISIPKDMGTFNCGAFVAGIVRGVLDSAGFPAVVTAHFVPVEGQQRPRTTILIKFAEEQKYPSIFLTSLPCLNPPQKLGTTEGSKAGLILAPKLSYLIRLNVSQQNDEAV